MTPERAAVASWALAVAALIALVAILSGCGGYPDRETVQGWTLAEGSLPAPDGWLEALDGVRERAPCAIPVETWGGVVTYTAEGYGRSADLASWWPGDVPRIGVAVAAGLPGLIHGGCHAAQYLCWVEAVHDAAFLECAEEP